MEGVTIAQTMSILTNQAGTTASKINVTVTIIRYLASMGIVLHVTCTSTLTPTVEHAAKTHATIFKGSILMEDASHVNRVIIRIRAESNVSEETKDSDAN